MNLFEAKYTQLLLSSRKFPVPETVANDPIASADRFKPCGAKNNKPEEFAPKHKKHSTEQG